MQHLQKNTTLQGGKYKIERVLGQGGFGITYRAMMKETASGKLGAIEVEVPVAIKEFFMSENCMRSEGSSYVSVPSTGSRTIVEQYRKKFVKEANNLAELWHPNIVRVIDVFEENGTDYYVMEFLEGGSLRDLVKQKGKIAEEEALRYVSLIGYALSYMHTEKHMCHFDVKPSNIMLDKNGVPKLIDFGISKSYDSEGNQTSSTPVGISKGFAPLEQYQQSVTEFSPQTDIYALGATLYYLLTGDVPPEASIVFNDGLPELPSSISASTCQAIEKAMQPRKKDRPQTIKAFLELLLGSKEASLYISEKSKPEVRIPIVKEGDEDDGTYYADEGASISTPPYTPAKQEEEADKINLEAVRESPVEKHTICKECGTIMQESMRACPKCGCPNPLYSQNQNEIKETVYANDTKPRKSLIRKILSLSSIVLGIGIMSWAFFIFYVMVLDGSITLENVFLFGGVTGGLLISGLIFVLKWKPCPIVNILLVVLGIGVICLPLFFTINDVTIVGGLLFSGLILVIRWKPRPIVNVFSSFIVLFFLVFWTFNFGVEDAGLISLIMFMAMLKPIISLIMSKRVEMNLQEVRENLSVINDVDSSFSPEENKINNIDTGRGCWIIFMLIIVPILLIMLIYLLAN